MQAPPIKDPVVTESPPTPKDSRSGPATSHHRLRLASHMTDATPEQIAERSPQETSNFTVLASRPKFMASQRRLHLIRDEDRSLAGAHHGIGSIRLIGDINLATNTFQRSAQTEKSEILDNLLTNGERALPEAAGYSLDKQAATPPGVVKKHAPRLSLSGVRASNPLPCTILKTKPVMVYMPKKELEVWKVKPLKKGSSIGERGSKIGLPSSHINVGTNVSTVGLGPIPLTKKSSIGDRKPQASPVQSPALAGHTGLKSVPPKKADSKGASGNELEVAPTNIRIASSPELAESVNHTPFGLIKLNPVPSMAVGGAGLPPKMMQSDPSQNKNPSASKLLTPSKPTSVERVVASAQELPSDIGGSRRRKEQVKGWESPVEKYTFPPKAPKKQSGASTATGSSGANPINIDATLTALGDHSKTPK